MTTREPETEAGRALDRKGGGISPDDIIEVEREARAELRRSLAEKVRALPSGWTRPEDQFGPTQYEWLYKAAVLALIEGSGQSDLRSNSDPASPEPRTEGTVDVRADVGSFAEHEDHLRQRAARGWVEDEDVAICLREIDRLLESSRWHQSPTGWRFAAATPVAGSTIPDRPLDELVSRREVVAQHLMRAGLFRSRDGSMPAAALRFADDLILAVATGERWDVDEDRRTPEQRNLAAEYARLAEAPVTGEGPELTYDEMMLTEDQP